MLMFSLLFHSEICMNLDDVDFSISAMFKALFLFIYICMTISMVSTVCYMNVQITNIVQECFHKLIVLYIVFQFIPFTGC